MHSKITNYITNANLLTDHFGYWPNFHDAEIVELVMTKEGPNIEMKLYTYEITNELDEKKSYKTQKNVSLL